MALESNPSDNRQTESAQPGSAASKYQVDMISSAKDAQWTKEFLGASEVVKAVAPAKVNLFLAVGTKQPDGYHSVTNIMHSLALHDVLYIGRKKSVSCGSQPNETQGMVAYAGPSENIAVRIDISDKTVSMHECPVIIPVEENLVYKAIDSLARSIGYNTCEEISVRIEKNIPVQAGVGGGSSDAAAALVAAAGFWGIDAASPALIDAAGELGADVAFFLQGGCAEYVGNGNTFKRTLEPMRHPVVLVKPKGGVSTKLAYEAFDRLRPSVPESLEERAKASESADTVPLFNNLAPAAFEICPQTYDVLDWLKSSEGVLEKDGVPQCLLSGSGAAVFAVATSFSSATQLAAEASAKGLWARATTFCPLHATVMKAE